MWADSTNVSPVEAPRAQLSTLLVASANELGVASLPNLLETRGARIRAAEHHTDASLFCQRIEFTHGDLVTLEAAIRVHCANLHVDYRLYSDRPRRVAILVSKQDHCLYDLLVRHRAGELDCELAMIISNHAHAAPIAAHFGIPFHHLPVDRDSRAEQEAAMLMLLYVANVELIVLARYMQVLSQPFCERFPMRIINIHHSFLPAFVGANPYRQAHEKGVKLIGATSHYVTADLDQGPIIEQETIRVSHRDTVEDLTRKGRDLERQVLAAALRAHLGHRVMIHANKTIVF